MCETVFPLAYFVAKVPAMQKFKDMLLETMEIMI
jgi:hypothetical protein